MSKELFNFGPGVKWPGVAKMLEEMGELAQPLGKLVMVRGKDKKHWSGPLRPSIVEESADVMAAVMFLAEENFTTEEMAVFIERRSAKLAQYKEWHRKGEEL